MRSIRRPQWRCSTFTHVKTSIATLKTHKEQQASRLAQQEALEEQLIVKQHYHLMQAIRKMEPAWEKHEISADIQNQRNP